jgi:hypothetical protein
MTSSNSTMTTGLVVLLAVAFIFPTRSAEAYRRLSDAEIKAKLTGMEISDPHFSEQYMRDGTVRIVTMGRRIVGKWRGAPNCASRRPSPRIPAAKRSGGPATSISFGWRATPFLTMSFSKSRSNAGGDNARTANHSNRWRF